MVFELTNLGFITFQLKSLIFHVTIYQFGYKQQHSRKLIFINFFLITIFKITLSTNKPFY